MAGWIPLLLLTGLAGVGQVQAQDWTKNATVPVDGRPNPYGLPENDLPAEIRAGRLHALNYPVQVTGVLLPYRPIADFVNGDSPNPLRFLLEKLISGFDGYSSMDQLESWIGMQSYPKEEGEGPYLVPFQNGKRPVHRMGFTLMDTPNGQGFTVSCAECHSANLFGRRVLGLTNRFPRANETFVRALELEPNISPDFFQLGTGATDKEKEMYRKSQASLRFVGAKLPVQLGLDTSLAQVALSLAKRTRDDWATEVPGAPARPDPIEHLVSDSKPAVWWNVKYKNRWLSDGSIVSGNPIFTNFIWNEIGRGTDLRSLSGWLSQNPNIVRELTTAVFSAEAPRYTDFFPASSIDEQKARHGEQLFNQHCSKCHGVYSKAWSAVGSESLAPEDRLKTVHVDYQNHVINVGTDPGRHQGMASLVQLNDLEISKINGIVIEPQQGYVPPPLVGIWARWPYFHNNSAPSLCAVLTKAGDRPRTYWAREATDPGQDFDQTCNGYPLKHPVDASFAHRYDTRREGMHNSGHDEGIFLSNGQEMLTVTDKLDVIEFLKTL